MKIVFATNNKHKLEEIKDILGKDLNRSLAEIGCHEDIPETGATLEENARQKSSYVVEHYVQNCFADDTGLRWRHSVVNPVYIQLVMQREPTTIARRICVSCWQT